MEDWIKARRAEIIAQQEQALGAANQAAGALKLLAVLEVELAARELPKEETPPAPIG